MAIGAGYDQLTGLMNMRSFLIVLDEYINTRTDGRQAVIYFNLVNFKYVNARCGIEEGDRLLMSMAAILTETFPGEPVARLSHDHFGVCTYIDDVPAAVMRVHDAILEYHSTEKLEVKAGIRYLASGEKTMTSVICDQAKLACDSIRNRADLVYLVYFDELSTESERNAYIVTNLSRAIARNDITLNYQPIVRTLTENLYGLEALARWRDPVYGDIDPSIFIPVLESSHEIQRLDDAIMRMVCEHIRERLDLGVTVVPVAFNLSWIDFTANKPFERLEQLVAEYDIPRRFLRVEITESSLVSNASLVEEQIKLLLDSGYQVWMDDFGTGYSSLNLLRKYRFTGIKFDASLLRELDERGRGILASMVQMAKGLGSRTLCEGAETLEQVNFLRSIGCETIQGYYYGRPMSYEESIRHCEARGIFRETPDETKALDEVGKLNLVTDAPLAIFMDNNDATTSLFSNQAYLDLLGNLGFDSSAVAKPLSGIFDESGTSVEKKLLDRAAQSNVEESVVLPQGSHVIRLNAKMLASSKSYRYFSIMPLDITNIVNRERTVFSDSLIEAVLFTYSEVFLLDFETDSCTAIETNGSIFAATEPIVGVGRFLRSYSTNYVHPNDRQRFNAGLREDEVFSDHGKGTSGRFRRHESDGSYQDSEFVVTPLPKHGTRQAILCIRKVPQHSLEAAKSGAALAADGIVAADGSATSSESTRSIDSLAAFDMSLNDSLAIALSEDDPNAGVQRFVEDVGQTFESMRSYIIEVNGDRTCSATYEWCDSGVEPIKDRLQDVDFSKFLRFEEYFKDQRILMMPDSHAITGPGPEADLRVFFASRGVRSAAVVPLNIGGRRVGYFSVESPSPRLFETDGAAFITTAQFLSIMLRNRDVMRHLDYLSMRDDLTGILNRRGLEKYFLAVGRGVRLVLVYGDINNLKQVNDSYGHDAGDEMIKQVGDTMLSVAGRGHVFRLGGDEFAMTFELGENEDATTPVKRVRAAFEKIGVSIALGYSEARTPIKGVEEFLAEADRRMYANKVEMHAARGEK